MPLWGSPSTHTNNSTGTSSNSASNKIDITPINTGNTHLSLYIDLFVLTYLLTLSSLDVSISHTATTEMNRSYEEDQLEDLVVLEDPIFPLKLSSCRVLIPQVRLYVCVIFKCICGCASSCCSTHLARMLIFNNVFFFFFLGSFPLYNAL